MSLYIDIITKMCYSVTVSCCFKTQPVTALSGLWRQHMLNMAAALFVDPFNQDESTDVSAASRSATPAPWTTTSAPVRTVA